MSETSSAAQRSASASGFAKDERLRLALVAGGILFALAVAVVFLRLQRLNELPPGLTADEGAHGVHALRVLQGEHAVFFPGNDGREGLAIYAVALATSLLGRTALAVRLPMALASAGTVFVVFWLGRLLFGRDEESGRATPWRGLLIGGVGAGLLAVSLGQTVIGRAAIRSNFVPLFLSLCLALLWQGRRLRVRHGGTWWLAALAGVCGGLLPYTYISARFTPFLFLLFGLSFVLPLRSVTREFDGATSLLSGIVASLNRVRAELPWLGVFVGVAGLVAAPILVHFALHPESFFIRTNQLLVFRPDLGQGNPLGAFLGNVWAHLLIFGFRGDPDWRRNFAGQPMLNIYEAVFFWLGVGMAVWRWQRPAYRLLLLWLGVLLMPGILAWDLLVPSYNRITGATPAIYLLVGVGVWEAFRFLKDRFFRENVTKAAIAVGVVVSVSVLVQGALTYHTYFQKWAAASGVEGEYERERTELIRMLNAQPSNADMVYLIPSTYLHHGFEYLYQGATPVHLIVATMPNLPQKIESTLAAMANVSAVKVVDWNSDLDWVDDGTERIVLLLDKYGRYRGSDEYGRFQILTYTDISLDRPWTFYEHMEPLTVHYDGGISLLGLALGQGEEQLSSQQLFNLGEDRSLWVGLHWSTAPELDINYAISLRLYNAEGESAYQEDAMLWKPDLALTGRGGPSELFDTMVQLDFPAGLPLGEYELRLVVYDSKTLKPTVELGVWEPEFVLARLRLADGATSQQ